MPGNLVHSTIVSIGRMVRGKDFDIDSTVPVGALFAFSLRRGVALLRCLFKGVVISLDPKKLVFLGSGAVIRNRRMVTFGQGVTIGEGVVIDGLSRDGVRIGDSVSIGPHTIIEATGVIRNIGKGFKIGNNSGMGAFSFVGAAGGVEIGSDVIMGQRVSFHSENHTFDDIDVPIRLQGVTNQGIQIEDDCWVGANVVFLDGSHVGKGCVIAAGTVVRGEVPSYSVVAGVPGKVIKKRVASKAKS